MIRIAGPTGQSRHTPVVDASNPDDPRVPRVRAPRLPARRDLLRAGTLAAAATLVAPFRATAQGQPRPVPRNRTLVVVWGGREGRWVDHELWNPYAVGANHQNGVGLLYEPLAYYSAFADAHPGFRFVPCFSRELPEPGSAHAHADVREGYVQNALAEFAPDGEADIAYLCGNPNMVDACFEALKAAGLPIPQIRREKYVSNK